MVIWPTLQTNMQEKTDNAPPNGYDFKICEKLTHCTGAKDICETMWLFLQSTHLVQPIRLVHPWKILVHPGVHDTPG